MQFFFLLLLLLPPLLMLLLLLLLLVLLVLMPSLFQPCAFVSFRFVTNILLRFFFCSFLVPQTGMGNRIFILVVVFLALFSFCLYFYFFSSFFKHYFIHCQRTCVVFSQSKPERCDVTGFDRCWPFVVLFVFFFFVSALFFFFSRIIHSFHSLFCVCTFFLIICFGQALYLSNDPKRHQRIFAHGKFLCISMCARERTRRACAQRCIHFYYMARQMVCMTLTIQYIFYFVRSRYVDRLLQPRTFVCINIYLTVLLDGVARSRLCSRRTQRLFFAVLF